MGIINNLINSLKDNFTMAEFSINGRMTVKSLRKQFKDAFGASLRVYKGAKFAPEDATLASIRSGENVKGGELVCKGNLQVGNFETKMKEMFGITVKVANPDNTKLASSNMTIAAAGREAVATDNWSNEQLQCYFWDTIQDLLIAKGYDIEKKDLTKDVEDYYKSSRYKRYGITFNIYRTKKKKDVTFTGSIVAYTIDSITVSGPATVNSTDGSAKAPKISDLNAVASYRDSSGAVKTVNLIAADLKLYGTASFVDSGVTEVSEDEPTALAKQTVQVKWQSAVSADFEYTVQYVKSTEPAPTYTYVWADTAETDGYRQIAYEILPETAANRYIQRGEFNADDFVAVYKVMVPTDEDGVVVTEENFKKAYEEAGYAEKDIPEYYQLEKLTAGKGETLSVTLTNPLEVTVDEKTTTYADRFAEAEDAAISLVYEYVGNEATGELVVLSNTENNTVIGQVTRDDSGKAIVDVDAGVDGLKIENLIADYATDVNIKIADGEAGSAQATPVEAGTEAEDLELTITAKTWKSGFRASDLADADNVVSPITITGTVPSVSGDAAKSTSVSVVLQMTDTIYSDSRYSKNITGVWVQNEIV